MQWGKNFPNADNDGLMFVGRATNGWQDHDYKASSFFGNSFGQLFNLPDQMQWVEGAEGSSNYNTKSSAFWRVIKAVSSHFYPSNWSSYVAWSDVCKVAPFEEAIRRTAFIMRKLKTARKFSKLRSRLCHQRL